MIEFALEKYPVRQTLSAGVQMLLRPLQPDDTSAFTRFHDAIPKGERFLIKHRVNGVGEIDSWCHDLNYDKRLTLVAIADGGVVGYASLNQHPGGWKRRHRHGRRAHPSGIPRCRCPAGPCSMALSRPRSTPA